MHNAFSLLNIVIYLWFVLQLNANYGYVDASNDDSYLTELFSRYSTSNETIDFNGLKRLLENLKTKMNATFAENLNLKLSIQKLKFKIKLLINTESIIIKSEELKWLRHGNFKEFFKMELNKILTGIRRDFKKINEAQKLELEETYRIKF